MTLLSWILSMSTDHSMNFQLSDGRSIQQSVAFLAPYIRDKSTWPYPHDISYWDEQPNDGMFMILAALAYQNTDYLTIWKRTVQAFIPSPTNPGCWGGWPVTRNPTNNFCSLSLLFNEQLLGRKFQALI